MSFVHLHVHSGYSLSDSVIKIDELIKTAKAMNMPAVALIDHGQMFGLMEFYHTALAAGVKPILGVEALVAADRRQSSPGFEHHLILLAGNMEGYKNLCRLISLANIDGFDYQPRVDKKLLAAHSKGLFALSACLQGEIPALLLEDRPREARRVAEEYARIFPGRFYVEIHRHGLDEEAEVNPGLIGIARTLGLPLVAANDCHYLRREDAELHDIQLCVQQGCVVADEDRFHFLGSEYYLKSPTEMAAAFPDLREALDNTLTIAERCRVEFPRRRRAPARMGFERRLKNDRKRKRPGCRVVRLVEVTRHKPWTALVVVGRVVGLREDEVEQLAELAMEEQGFPAALLRAAPDNPGVAKLLALAAGLDNLPIHCAPHPTALVIGDRNLWEYLPLARLPGSGLITQYERKDVEALGLSGHIDFQIHCVGRRRLDALKRKTHNIAAHKMIEARAGTIE